MVSVGNPLPLERIDFQHYRSTDCSMVLDVAPKAKRRPGERGPEIPVLVRMKARTMYLNSGLPMKDIAASCGFTLGTLASMARKEGWIAAKNSLKAKIEAKQDIEGAAITEQAMEQIKQETLQIAGESMSKIRQALAREDQNAARDFQSLTAGARNLVTIAKAIMQPSEGAGANGAQINLFMLRAGDALDSAKAVSQVTEIDSKPSA